MMKKLIFISLLFVLAISCGNPSKKQADSYDLPTVTKDEVVLVELNDGLGIPKVLFHNEPYTGIVKDFQGYYVAEQLRDSVAFNSGFAFYSEGMLDSVIVPVLAEKRYFNGDNFIDSIYMEVVMENGDKQTRILYFEEELLTNMKVIEK